MIASRTELATAAKTKLREHSLNFANFQKRIKYLEANTSANRAWKLLQIQKVAEDTAFELTENQLENLISSLYRIGKVSINEFLTS